MSSQSTASSACIRSLRPEDHERWQQLWGQYLDFYRQPLPTSTTQWVWQKLLEDKELHGFAALDAQTGKMIGFVHYHFHLSTWSPAGYCYLEDLFVAPDHRGQRAGRGLIEAVYRAADERGAARVYWHTENTNARAQVLYHQIGRLTPFLQFRR